MKLQSPDHQVDLPAGMRRQLEGFRRRVWIIKLAEGIFCGLFGLLVSYLAVFIVDRFVDTPPAVRLAILLVGTTGLAIGLPRVWHRWVWGTRRLEQVARLLKRRFPRIGDQLLGIVELSQSRLEQQRSETLCRAAMQQVDQQTHGYNFNEAVPNPRHKQWAWLAIGAAAIAGLILIGVPAAGRNALLRWLLPWSDTARYTFAQLQPLPEKLYVPLAEPFTVRTPLAAEAAWRPPEAAARYGDQPAIRAALADNAYEFTIPGQKKSDRLLVSAGDSRQSVTVEPTPRPELLSFEAQIQLPEYLQYSRPVSVDARGGTISLVKGSQATLIGAASRDLAEVRGPRQAIDVEGATFHTSISEVREPEQWQFTWKDTLGLSAKSPFVLKIQANDDAPPTVSCTQLGHELVVLDSDVLTFEVAAGDDFGVKSIGIQWEGIPDALRNPHPSRGETMLCAGGPEMRNLSHQAAFCPRTEGIPPQSLQVRLFAIDYLPDRERSYSTTYTLHVLSPEEHAIWLTHQMQKWFRQAQTVYEREHQLHEANKQLRALPADQLDHPDVRRRIESQAKAESANARQLAAVTRAGEGLLKQATRNDQFNVTTLETWAEMLQALDALAQQRMPSVADLLQQAADAPGSTPSDGQPAPPSDSQQANAAPKVGANRDVRPGQPGKSKPPSKPVPSIVDVESSFNESNPPKKKDGEQESKPSSNRLTLPVTTVQGGGPKRDEQDSEKPPAAPAEEKVAHAVQEQEDLLAEFARIADELQKILNNLEGSTFVKRLKAASRRQLDVAKELNESLQNTFGLVDTALEEPLRKLADAIAERESAQSDNVYTIERDLEAYFNRVQDGKFKSVLDEMQATQITSQLRQIGETVKVNYTGQSLAQTEFWADTLDRWAEQLVGPGCPNGQCPGGDAASLPPSLVLEVMKILDGEIGLREQTRAVESARAAVDAAEHQEKCAPLTELQLDLADRTHIVVDKIHALPDGEQYFVKEIALLRRVEEVMREAQQLLASAETGAPTIAAETEAIELLLQSRRVNPNAGGGGGSSPGSGGTGDTKQSALALLGRGDERNAVVTERHTRPATGVSGSELPAEFRQGLDAYFEALEQQSR